MPPRKRIIEEGPWHVVASAERTHHARWHPRRGFGGWATQAAAVRYIEEQAAWSTPLPAGATVERCMCAMADEQQLADPASVDVERDNFYDGARTYDPERWEPTIERQPVNPPSSDLVSCGWGLWDTDGTVGVRARPCLLAAGIPCGVLEVEFKNGSVYRYYHVAEQVALVMQGRYGAHPLESVGKYFHASIRRNDVVKYRRMPDVEATSKVDAE